MDCCVDNLPTSDPTSQFILENVEGEQEIIEEIPETECDQRPVLLIPFYPNISDRLRKLASAYGFQVWFTYPGNVTEKFTQHRGRTHKSKSQNSVYCCYCTCGTQYVGESMRNLKI